MLMMALPNPDEPADLPEEAEHGAGGMPPEPTHSAPGQGGRVYFPHLDGLRFWAFFAVFLAHIGIFQNPNTLATPSDARWHEWLIFGYLGVDFFFVLSGFLITYLLLAEQQKTGCIAIGAFYMRRALRIWPLYFACVAVGYSVGSRFFYGPLLPPVLYFATFTTNLLPFFPWTQGHPYNAGLIGVLWSVAVEEQFYLVWPLLMGAVLGSALHRAGRTWLLFAAVCTLSIGWRIALRESQNALTTHTMCVIGDMAMGGWAAWNVFTNPRWPAWFAALGRRSIVAAYLVLAALTLSYIAWRQSPWLLALSRPVMAAGFAFVILEQCYARHSFYKCGHSRLLSRLGTYTYGLYCLHLLVGALVQKFFIDLGWDKSLGQLFFVQAPVMLAATIFVAMLSYHCFEKPFLNLKRRFAHI